MKTEEIAKLYNDTHTCTKCFSAFGCKLKFDALKVRRELLEQALESEIFIVGQALGQNSQRLSGIPYTYINQQLSKTGKKLDKYLSFVGHTLMPDNDRKLVYSSDIVHCYPGKKNGEGDNKPTAQEILNCHD